MDEDRLKRHDLTDGEWAIGKLRRHCAVATQFDKRDYVWRGTIDVASIRIWLRDPVP